jgi:hypothetical protein
LKGEALEAIQDLGHTAIAYEKAKERMERKYGGKRRLISKFLDEMAEFPTIRSENSSIVKKFADLLMKLEMVWKIKEQFQIRKNQTLIRIFKRGQGDILQDVVVQLPK